MHILFEFVFGLPLEKAKTQHKGTKAQRNQVQMTLFALKLRVLCVFVVQIFFQCFSEGYFTGLFLKFWGSELCHERKPTV
jgi:hypothetical protein